MINAVRLDGEIVHLAWKLDQPALCGKKVWPGRWESAPDEWSTGNLCRSCVTRWQKGLDGR